MNSSLAAVAETDFQPFTDLAAGRQRKVLSVRNLSKGQNAHGIFLAVFLLSVDDNRKKRERKEAQYPGPHRQLLQLFKNAPGRLDTDRVRIAFVCQHHDAKVFFWNEGYVAAKSTSGARFMHP